MPKTRQIKHDFFLDEDLAKCSALARLLFCGLWVLADREGRLEYRPAKIKAQLMPYHEANVPALLGELAPAHVIYYEKDDHGYLAVRNFKKHQHIHKDEKDSIIPAPPKESMEIPGNPRKSPEIPDNREEIIDKPSVPTPSSVPFPSPSPNANGTPSAVDWLGHRLNEHIPEFGGLTVCDLSVRECRFILHDLRPNKDDRAALEWWIAQKEGERVGQSKKPPTAAELVREKP